MSNFRKNLIRVAYTNPELRGSLLQVIASGAMPEPEFWEIVDGLGWGTKTTDYKALKKHLLRNLSPNQADGMRTTFSQMSGKLYRVLTKWEEAGDTGDGAGGIRTPAVSFRTWLETGKRGNPREFGLGDDSFGDLLAHIIGMGKREYEAVLKNPQRALDRARSDGYKESFAYALPYTADYALLDVSTAQKGWEKIHSLAEWLLMRPEIPRALVRPLQVLTEGTHTFNRKGVHAFLENGDELENAAKLIQSWWDKFARDWTATETREILVKAMPDALMHPGHIYWAVKNQISDMRDFLSE